ncbi:hypothetical protein HKCCE3408_15735 [Rhodobacterales bacterium HKCCE3408]|nr:hypothetical protein [Rhodobacterales bacterium HKCCE3408]
MFGILPLLRGFAREETGAVTADFVVLAAGIVGLGLAVIMVTSGGVEDLAGETQAALVETEPGSGFAVDSVLADLDFSSGLGGFVGGTLETLSGFGDVLQIGAGETASMTLDMPPGTETATFTFDIIGGDDLDTGDTATILINGEPVALYTDDHGNITTQEMAGAGMTVSVEQQYSNTQMGAGSHGHDSRATYTITMSNPPGTVTLGVQSGADQDTSNEFYALDDVSVVAN